MDRAVKKLNELNASPQEYNKFQIKINQDGKKRSAYEVLGYPETTWNKLKLKWPQLKELNLNETIERQIKSNSFYSRYTQRQEMEIEELKKDQALKIRRNVNYQNCRGLSNEVRKC